MNVPEVYENNINTNQGRNTNVYLSLFPLTFVGVQTNVSFSWKVIYVQLYNYDVLSASSINTTRTLLFIQVTFYVSDF